MSRADQSLGRHVTSDLPRNVCVNATWEVISLCTRPCTKGNPDDVILIGTV